MSKPRWRDTETWAEYQARLEDWIDEGDHRAHELKERGDE